MTFQQYIQQKNLDISIVNLEDLGLSQRIDPESYKPKIIYWLEKVKEKNHVKFGKLIDILTDYTANGSFASLSENVNVSDEVGYAKWIRIQNLDNDNFEENVRYVDEKGYDFLKKSKLFGGELLFSKTGEYLGKAYIFKGTDSKATLADNIFSIKLNENIKKEYIYIFINTSIGNAFVMRNSQGTGQPTIIKNSLRNIDIPIPSDLFQEKIVNLVQESFKQKELSKKLYLEAEKLLLSELGFEEYKPTEENISIKDSEEVELFGRIDAEYFQPKYDEIIEKIKDYELTELGNIVDFKKGIEPGSEAYDDFGIPFIRVSDVSVNGINKFEKYISTDLFDSLNGKYQPEKGDILFTKDGTIGISFVFDEDFDSVLSSAFLIFKTKIEINKYYLALVLNSIVCKLQIERFSGGALIEHLKPSDVNTLKIPILGKQIQEKISDLILESKKSRILSKQLLEKAKKSVEIFIEEDEEKAENFLTD